MIKFYRHYLIYKYSLIRQCIIKHGWNENINSTYQSLRALGGHRLHYQVHINTNLKLFPKIGKTFRLMEVRVSKYQGVSPRTGKHLKGTLSTSVRDHMLDCNHVVAWDDFKVLGRESNHWLLEIKESLFIKRDRPSLNKNIYSQESSLV